MKTMTIRNVPTELAQALDRERQRRGLSLNRTVLALLRNALGMSNSVVRSNGLRHLAGAWSEAEYRQFSQAVAPLGEIDEAMWRLSGSAWTRRHTATSKGASDTVPQRVVQPGLCDT